MRGIGFEWASVSRQQNLTPPTDHSETEHYTPAMKKRERLKIKYNLGGGDITFKRLTRKEAEEEDLDRLRGKTLAQISPPLSLSLRSIPGKEWLKDGRTE